MFIALHRSLVLIQPRRRTKLVRHSLSVYNHMVQVCSCVTATGKLGKVRQHVNPLAPYFQQPLTIHRGWNKQVYRDSTKPLLIDLGSGKGWFCLRYAETYPDWNVLGLEIREALVQRALTWIQQRQLTNLYYMFCNINVSLAQILENIVDCKVLRVSIQFPDPHFKRRHHKRRLVTDELVQTLFHYLPNESEVLIQTDVEETYFSAIEKFQNNQKGDGL
ncbi:tRNA (guanine-N7-)-methyltransferase [Galdieria sulphuraria]|uniref:tRNA (guanine(46)-N(7))-methyltransferase n=1 Tax=Galdieria sulphuraria TaxID=130081 RepID=M2VZP7_GALSU|nr:tRNA (guanine-N7-)-methyltransferase [Galdieria sulphuraria]EME28821.1 tRNA (guanine-N7-)-methyltransferase [Galdieria sulphuraria]|eukprot:XP_005705341.1 tRNA (guanine-N7-)-methyltransferase [Galdieria sulphuraria]